MGGGVVVAEQEYSREDMLSMGYLLTFDQYIGGLSPEETRAGAEKINRMLELKPHEVQSHLEHVLGIRSFGGAQGYNFQGEFGKYMAPGSQGGHGLGYHQNWNHA